MTQIDVRVVAAFFVDHAIGIRVVANEIAMFEMFCQEIAIETDGDQSLRLVLRIASVPEGIGPADDGRKAIFLPKEIDRTSLAVVSYDDSGLPALSGGNSSVHIGDGLD